MRSFVRLISLSPACALLSITLCGQAVSTVQPPQNEQAVLTVQGRGAQIYGCQPLNGSFQWVFQAPVARLFDAQGNEVGTHADGPTWTLQDSSSIQGLVVARQPSPDAASIPWLLLKAINPLRNGALTKVDFIRRSDTQGGIAPSAGCDATHRGDLVRVPYTATYTFYASGPAKS